MVRGLFMRAVFFFLALLVALRYTSLMSNAANDFFSDFQAAREQEAAEYARKDPRSVQNVQGRLDRAMARAGISPEVVVASYTEHAAYRDYTGLEFSCPRCPDLATRARDWAAQALATDEHPETDAGRKYGAPYADGAFRLVLNSWKIGD